MVHRNTSKTALAETNANSPDKNTDTKKYKYQLCEIGVRTKYNFE